MHDSVIATTWQDAGKSWTVYPFIPFLQRPCVASPCLDTMHNQPGTARGCRTSRKSLNGFLLGRLAAQCGQAHQTGCLRMLY